MGRLEYYFWWLLSTIAAGSCYVFLLMALDIDVSGWRVGLSFALLLAVIEIHGWREKLKAEKNNE